MIKKLSALKVGDKFWFTDRPYLVVDIDTRNMSLHTDFSNIKFVMCLSTYKSVGLDKNITVVQDLDNFPV